MGTLIVNNINLNNTNVVNNLRSVIQGFISDSSSYYPLKFKPEFYFEIPNGSCPRERGWYITLDGKMAIYVGKSYNLNARLNTNTGSIDNFANQGRTFDPERNFIKKFNELIIFNDLRVCIILESALCLELIMPNNLTELDRGNIEKLINIFRCHFNYI